MMRSTQRLAPTPQQLACAMWQLGWCLPLGAVAPGAAAQGRSTRQHTRQCPRLESPCVPHADWWSAPPSHEELTTARGFGAASVQMALVTPGLGREATAAAALAVQRVDAVAAAAATATVSEAAVLGGRRVMMAAVAAVGGGRLVVAS